MTMPGRRLDVVCIAGVIVISVAAGGVAASKPRLAPALIVLAITAAVILARPVLCAVLVLPGLYGYQGIGFGGSLGISDSLLIVGAALALPALAGRGRGRDLRLMQLAFIVYLMSLTPSLILQPSSAAFAEVVHRVVIVLGATIVGAWLAQEHKIKAALRLIASASVFFAIAAIATWLTNGHNAAYPLGYHKNYAGSMLALVLLVLLCAPRAASLPSALRLPVLGLLVLGVLATQSRGAILGAALGALIWLFAPREGGGVTGRTRVLAAAFALSFGVYASYSVQQQITSGDVETNSVGVRQDVEAYTRELWRTSPLDGIGLRYFNSGRYGPLAQAPTNAINNELAESGLAGAAGFVFFHGVVLRVLWRRRRSPLGLAGLAIFSGQLLHGMFDIYWSSGITPLPFIVAGMALHRSGQDGEGMRTRNPAAVPARA